jgi:hypothetical protein
LCLRANKCFLMVLLPRGCGHRAKKTVRWSSSTHLEKPTRATGLWTKEMGKAFTLGSTETLRMETGSSESELDSENTFLLMVLYRKDNSITTFILVLQRIR